MVIGCEFIWPNLIKRNGEIIAEKNLEFCALASLEHRASSAKSKREEINGISNCTHSVYYCDRLCGNLIAFIRVMTLLPIQFNVFSKQLMTQIDMTCPFKSSMENVDEGISTVRGRLWSCFNFHIFFCLFCCCVFMVSGINSAINF